MPLGRRGFLKKVAAVKAGAVLSTGALRQTRKPADVIVVGLIVYLISANRRPLAALARRTGLLPPSQ